LFSLSGAHAGTIDPKALLKANMFSFDNKVEAITGHITCEDALDRLVADMGANMAKEMSDSHMAAVMNHAYDQGISDYYQDKWNAAPGDYEEKRNRLLHLMPSREEYDPGSLRTEEGRTNDFLVYLVNELTKLEKAAMINRGIVHLTHRRGIQQPHNLPGLEGQAYRLILFIHAQVRSVKVPYEPALKIFAEAFLTPEILRQSVEPSHIDSTRSFFHWMAEHNQVLYLYFLDKYLTVTTEENLLLYY
jgi:hypothetical protein